MKYLTISILISIITSCVHTEYIAQPARITIKGPMIKVVPYGDPRPLHDTTIECTVVRPKTVKN